MNSGAKYKNDYFRIVNKDELFIQRCIELALNGAGYVSPNPLVGAIIVHNEKIIGEGWHKKFGESHAEVNAINSVEDKNILSASTLYVNLEPCCHQGKTPACCDLIIKNRFQKVVVGMTDPFEKVLGEGVKKLRAAGIEVVENILQKKCEELNKRFITFHAKKRPYIILKWTQTLDGFIAPDISKMSAEEFENKRHITGFVVQKLVHKWRSEEDAILVGTNTAMHDNPALNVRSWNGKNPARIIIDRNLRLPRSLKIFDQTQPTIIFNYRKKDSTQSNLNFISIDFTKDISSQIIEKLFSLNIQSLIIEGGTKTLETFINSGLWDEAQLFISPKILCDGIKAPTISGKIIHQNKIDGVRLTIYSNHN